jgi:hypothetical protein
MSIDAKQTDYSSHPRFRVVSVDGVVEGTRSRVWSAFNILTDSWFSGLGKLCCTCFSAGVLLIL